VADHPDESIGSRIRRLRVERGLAQRDLAGPGASPAYLSRIEHGHRRPSLKVIRALAVKLGVTPEYLETGRTVAPEAEHEFRVAHAELELRLGKDPEKAAAAFREAAQASADRRLVARARAGLGLLAARRNDPREAIRLIEDAATELAPEARPDIYESLGEAYAADGLVDRAVALYERSLHEVREREPNNTALHARFAICLADALASLGELEPARKALDEATDATRELSVQSRIRIYWIEAVRAWQDDDSERALTFIRRAIAVLEVSEDTMQLARAHMVAGRMLNLDGRFDEAAAHLRRAEKMFTLGGKKVDFGILRAEEAHLAAHRGDAKRAVALAADAQRLLADDARFRSNMLHALAVAHAAAGDLDVAERHYRQALEELEGAPQWREAAQVARELAKLLLDAGHEAEAFELLDHAAALVIKHGVGRHRRKGSTAQRTRKP
jgi:transcriptional regulator with XRE-family HTH domain